MKQKIFTLSLFLLFSAVKLQAQTPVTGIAYTYDAAGNRIYRAPATSSDRKANPGTGEKKDSIVTVSKNSLQASFTPNPTTSGNFAVVVSNKEFLSNGKNTSSEKPQIFIYNPLGELIHQESAQYNTHAIINLSKYSKGIYIVKVQSGEDVLMHRMAYQ